MKELGKQVDRRRGGVGPGQLLVVEVAVLVLALPLTVESAIVLAIREPRPACISSLFLSVPTLAFS